MRIKTVYSELLKNEKKQQTKHVKSNKSNEIKTKQIFSKKVNGLSPYHLPVTFNNLNPNPHGW
jgi:hypothetical protein